MIISCASVATARHSVEYDDINWSIVGQLVVAWPSQNSGPKSKS